MGLKATELIVHNDIVFLGGLIVGMDDEFVAPFFTDVYHDVGQTSVLSHDERFVHRMMFGAMLGVLGDLQFLGRGRLAVVDEPSLEGTPFAIGWG